MQEGKVIVVTDEGDARTFTGTTNAVVTSEGVLHLMQQKESFRMEPVSILWGLYRTEHRVDESKVFTLAAFAHGRWNSFYVEGVLDVEPAVGEKAKK